MNRIFTKNLSAHGRTRRGEKLETENLKSKTFEGKYGKCPSCFPPFLINLRGITFGVDERLRKINCWLLNKAVLAEGFVHASCAHHFSLCKSIRVSSYIVFLGPMATTSIIPLPFNVL